MTSNMESTKGATDSANTTACDYVHAKLLADFEAMFNKLSTLPTEIALTGLEKHRRLIIDAELNPKTIEDSDTFEAAYQALKNFKDGQKCDLEMLINGPDGVLEMLNRCLAALEEAETEIATLRSKEGTKAVCLGQKMRKLTKEKEELEQEVEGLMEEIKVLKGEVEFQEGSASGSCSDEGEDAMIKPQGQAQQHEETGPPEAVSEAPANGVTEDAERNDCLAYGGRKMSEREEVDWCLGRLAKIWDDWSMQESEMLGLPKLKLENESLKKKLDEIRDVTIDLLISMDRLADVVKGPLGDRAPSENAGNAPRKESDEDEKDGSVSPSRTSVTATNEDNDARSPISRLPQVDLMTASDISCIQSHNARLMEGINGLELQLADLKRRRASMVDTDAADAGIAAVEREFRQWCRRGPDFSSLSTSSRRSSLDDEHPDVRVSRQLGSLHITDPAPQAPAAMMEARDSQAEEDVDASGLEESSIAAVFRGSECSRNRVIKALRESDGDIPFAVLDILQPVSEKPDAPSFTESDIKAVRSRARVGRLKATQTLTDGGGNVDVAVDVLQPKREKADATFT